MIFAQKRQTAGLASQISGEEPFAAAHTSSATKSCYADVAGLAASRVNIRTHS